MRLASYSLSKCFRGCVAAGLDRADVSPSGQEAGSTATMYIFRSQASCILQARGVVASGSYESGKKKDDGT